MKYKNFGSFKDKAIWRKFMSTKITKILQKFVSLTFNCFNFEPLQPTKAKVIITPI